MSALVCGLDVHKESTYATILGPDGEIVTQSRMPNEEVPGFLRPHRVERVAMEASTSIAPLHRKLVDEGYGVTVSHPRKTRYIAEARIKSDRVDSKTLAELLRLNSLPESYMPPRVATFWAFQSVIVAVGEVFHDAVYGTFEGVEGEGCLPSRSDPMVQVDVSADPQ